jgi:hypothetical protein
MLTKSLNRAWIWEELKVRGLPSKFINIIKEGYEDFHCRVIHEGQISDQINTSSGEPTGMSSVTIIVPADFGWGIA